MTQPIGINPVIVTSGEIRQLTLDEHKELAELWHALRVSVNDVLAITRGKLPAGCKASDLIRWIDKDLSSLRVLLDALAFEQCAVRGKSLYFKARVARND